MELWNNRKLKAPPTYTYQAKMDDVDIDHLAATLQDGIKFYKEQYLLNLETALLARIVYRMKRKFRNSKDFQTLEKVKKDLMIYLQIDIYNKLELLLSILSNQTHKNKVSLPTKNMMDFILVRLQGVGKILCRIVEMCKLTVQYYECRLHLGHFWRLALVAIGLVSRIYILSLNIIKFTCLFYIRLLPFSHKLKNSGVEWLPENYILPKDLKEWLNVEWTKLDEVIEIPDKDFNFALIDLVEDSDDEVQFCEEYIELNEDEDVEIIEEFKKINKRIKPIDYENNLTILRGFSSDQVDTGEVVSLTDENDKEEDIQFISNDELPLPAPVIIQDQEIHVKEKNYHCIDEIDLGELIALSEDENENLKILDINKSSETVTDCCEEVHDPVSGESILQSNQKQSGIQIEAEVLISSSDEELGDVSSNDSVKFVEEVASTSERPSVITSDFISLSTVNDRFPIQCNNGFPGSISRKLPSRRNNIGIDENTENLPCSQFESYHLKSRHILTKLDRMKQNHTQNKLHINSSLMKEKNYLIDAEKHSSIIELIDTPREKTHAGINHPEETSNELIEIGENTLNESIQNTPLSVKRKRNTKNSNGSTKRRRLSEDTTLDIADASNNIYHHLKSRHISTKSERMKENHTQNKLHINSSLMKNKNSLIDAEKRSSIIELIDTPKEKRRAGINHPEETSNELIEIGENTLNESIQNTPLFVKRKQNTKNSSGSTKRPRLSEDTTLDIADVSNKMIGTNMFYESAKQINIQSLREVSESNVSGKRNLNNRSGIGSFEIAEHSFCKTIRNTSTPAKKKRRGKTKKTKQKDIHSEDTTIDSDKTSPTKQNDNNISNIKQRYKKRNKKANKNNNLNVNSRSYENNTVHSVLTSSSINTSCNSNSVNDSSSFIKPSKRRNRPKKKKINHLGEAKNVKELGIKSSTAPKKKKRLSKSKLKSK